LLLPGPPTAQEEYLFKRYLPDNVEICQVSPDHYVLPETLIFTSFFTRRTLTWLPRGYLDDMLPNFLPKCPRHRCHRIFIERSEGHRGRMRVIDNQKELVQALAPLGFKSYRLEDLSFDEQISLFYDAEAVVAAHGAGLSNLIFSDCIDVLELHPSHMVIPTYYYLSECMGHSYRYWKGDRKHFEDSFNVDIDGVLGRLPEHLIKTEATQELT
jgi:capsular polysaccharide biosynthesis protein